MNKKTSFISDFKAIVFAVLLSFVLLFHAQSVVARTPAEIRNLEELNISQDMSSQDLSGNDFVKLDLKGINFSCLLYTSPSPRDVEESRMPSSA